MAVDNTPPKLKLIVTIGVICAVTLVALDFVFRSYLGFMNGIAQQEKLAPTKEREAQTAAEQAAFSKAKMPIDQAMKQVGAGTRAPEITPQPSDDTGALTGWMKLPKALPQAQMIGGGAAAPAVAPTGDAGVTTATGDAGVTTATGDAGAAAIPASAGDAGAPKPAPAPGHEHH